MIVLADPDPGFHARVAGCLGGEEELLSVYSLPQLETALTEPRGRAPVALLGPNLPAEESLRMAEWAQIKVPEVGVVVVTGTLTSDLLRAALRAGVRDVLPDSFAPAQLVETISRVEDTARRMRGPSTAGEAEPDISSHRVITVFSAKGGCGKSFLSCNLAVLLAQTTGEQVALVDLDLEFGDLAIMFQLFPTRTIHDTARNPEGLDAEALRGYLIPHRSKVRLLAAPVEPGLAETITTDALRTILRMLKRSFRYVVVDCPSSFTDHVLSALDESEVCVLLTSMDVPSIKNVKLALQTLELLRFGRSRVRLVLNRADSRVGLSVSEVEKTLGTSVDVSIPSSIRVPLSINRGTPLAIEDPKSPVISALSRLVELVAAGSSPPARQPRFRLGHR